MSLSNGGFETGLATGGKIESVLPPPPNSSREKNNLGRLEALLFLLNIQRPIFEAILAMASCCSFGSRYWMDMMLMGTRPSVLAVNVSRSKGIPFNQLALGPVL